MAKTEETVTLVALIEGISYDGALLAVGDAFETDVKNAAVLQAQAIASVPKADDDEKTSDDTATKATTAKAKTTTAKK